MTRSAGGHPLRPGDVVEVRSSEEILATLDESAALDGLPFMPELLRHAGRRYTVSRRVDKICDTIAATGSRRMRDTVYLENLRCDGSAHGGCQAGCLIYWKEAWLKRVDVHAGASPGFDGGVPELEALAQAGTRTVRAEGAGEVWRCQATDALEASEVLKTSNPGQYWRELTNGNYGVLHFVRVMARAIVMEAWFRLGKLKPLPLTGTGEAPPAAEPLNLQPGELVEVKSKEEIAATLDETGHLRRLSFDREMLPYCGKTFRVKDRARHIVDDKTGRMLKIPECLILEGTGCSGECSTGRWFCPRQIYPYWREEWVRRIDTPIDRLERSALAQAEGPREHEQRAEGGGASDGAVVVREVQPGAVAE
jgi:hypothetical protein